MSEISFFEVFAGTAVRSSPCPGRVSASSPCPSVLSRGLVPFRPRQPSPSVLLRRGGCSLPFLFPSCPSFPVPVPSRSPPVRVPWFPRLRGPLLLRVFLCESLCPSSVVSSAPFPVGHSAPGPVACPCDSGPEVSFACCFPLQMRSAPRGSGGKAAAGVGKCRKVRGRRGKIGKNVKKPKKVKKSP